MKAVLFARVSSKEQELEGYSLDAQIDKLREYSNRQGFEVLEEVQITESSNKGERKEFVAFLELTKLHSIKLKQPIVIVVDKVDRLVRNFKFYPIIDQLIQENHVHLHFVGDGTIINNNSNSSDKLMWNIRIVMSQNYTDSMVDNVKRSIDYKIKQGEVTGLAPLGYINVVKSKDNCSDVILDTERCFTIKRLFREYSTGTVSIRELVRRAKKYGLTTKKEKPITLSSMVRIITNKFYMGVATLKGKEYTHRYKNLIDKETFEKCQKVYQNYSKAPFRQNGKEFIFKGLIKCKNCKKMYSSEIKKHKYIYLRTTNKNKKCDCQAIKQEFAVTEVKKVLDSLKFPEELIKTIHNHIKSIHDDKNEYRDSRLKTLRKEDTRIKDMQDELLNQLLAKRITNELYDKKVLELNNRQQIIASELEAIAKSDESFYLTVSALLSVLSNTSHLFDSSRIEEKRRVLKFVFSNLEMNGSKLECTLNKPFDLLVKLPKCTEWRE